MSLSDEIRKKKHRLKMAVERGADMIAATAAERYASKGPNFPSELSLSKQIVPLAVREVGKKFQCIIVSSARSRSGYDYAARQHDDANLRHTVNPPGGTSFADWGRGSSREKRYRSGLQLAVGAPRFPLKYLEKASAVRRLDFVNEIKAALR